MRAKQWRSLIRAGGDGGGGRGAGRGHTRRTLDARNVDTPNQFGYFFYMVLSAINEVIVFITVYN